MKIYDETKTKVLHDPDLNKGYLKQDKLLIAHHESTPLVKGACAEEIYNQLKTDGSVAVRVIEGKYYRVDRAFKNGVEINPLSVKEWITGVHSCSVTKINDEPDTPAKDSWDEEENIKVYVPYTKDELRDRQLTDLRHRREVECFPIINRGQLWYVKINEDQKEELKKWYDCWLNVTETLEIPEKPSWLK